jgi:ABC-type Fe3+ transport system substrate-binding protein
VTIYGSPPAQQFGNITTAFKAKYPGIDVQYTSLQPPQAVQKISAELASQGYSADMVLQAATAVYPLEQAGTVIPYVSSYASGFPKAVLDPLNQSTPIIELAIGWVYNTQMVKPADVPTTMDQVANAKFKGLVVMNDPTTGTAFTQYWASLATTLGNSTVYNFLKSLKNATSPVILPTITSCATDVAGGAHAICLSAYMQEAAVNIQLSAPEKFLNITGLPLMITPSNAALIKNAQHPNAAKLLADFMASPTGQTVWGNIDVRTPVSTTVTAKWSITSELKTFDPGAGTLVYFPAPAVASAATAWGKTFLFLKS